jgi:hypothetical protein
MTNWEIIREREREEREREREKRERENKRRVQLLGCSNTRDLHEHSAIVAMASVHRDSHDFWPRSPRRTMTTMLIYAQLFFFPGEACYEKHFFIVKCLKTRAMTNVSYMLCMQPILQCTHFCSDWGHDQGLGLPSSQSQSVFQKYGSLTNVGYLLSATFMVYSTGESLWRDIPVIDDNHNSAAARVSTNGL